MKPFALALALLLGGLSALPATPAAAGEATMWRYNHHDPDLPFPRSKRAESVWASGACWSTCGSHCTWGLATCLTVDAQGQCLKWADACDRACQRDCRTRGGPLLPLDF